MEGAQPSFVGRVTERRAAVGAVERLRAESAGALVAIVGDGGIGKTRLCEEVLAAARERGIPSGYAACPEAAALAALAPWSMLLAQVSVDSGALTDPLEDGDPLRSRERRFTEVAAQLRAASDAAPMTLVLDDFHWADEASIAMLNHVAPLVRTMAVVLVVALRDEPGAALDDVLAGLRRHGTVLRLGGLAPREVAALAADTAGRALPVGLVAVLAEQTAGNPLFVTELARDLAAREGDVGAGMLPAPASIDTVFRSRLARCPASARAVADVVALAGEPATADLLSGVLGL
ncbi:MAG TPA: AAA family ATPase, partial [Acidimicrobiales bacterium]